MGAAIRTSELLLEADVDWLRPPVLHLKEWLKAQDESPSARRLHEEARKIIQSV